MRIQDHEMHAFHEIVHKYSNMPYGELARMANQNFITTEHPLGDDGIQVGVTIFYDDKHTWSIRCGFGLYKTDDKRAWWKFWDVPVYGEDVLISKPD